MERQHPSGEQNIQLESSEIVEDKEKLADAKNLLEQDAKQLVEVLGRQPTKEEIGDFAEYRQDEIIKQADADGVRTPEESQSVLLATKAVEMAAVDEVGESDYAPGNAIERSLLDGHMNDLVEGVRDTSTQDIATAAKEAHIIDASDNAIRMEALTAKKTEIRTTQTKTFEVFCNVEMSGLAKDERKKALDNPENWDPERQKVHQEIYGRALTEATKTSERLVQENPPPSQFTLRGNTASGKSTALRVNNPLFRGVLNEEGKLSGAINPDSLKGDLRKIDGDGDMSKVSAMQVHDEGSMLARRLTAELKSPDKSIVYDKRMEAREDIANLLEDAAETGRPIAMLDIDVPLELSLVRVLGRNKGGEDPNVPFDAVVEGYKGVRQNRHDMHKQFQANTDKVRGYVLMAWDPATKQSVEVATRDDAGNIVTIEGREELAVNVSRQVSEDEIKTEVDRLRNQVITEEYIKSYVDQFFNEDDQERAEKTAKSLEEHVGKTLKQALDDMAQKDIY